MTGRRAVLSVCLLAVAAATGARAAVIRQELKGVDAIKFAYGRGKHDFVKRASYGMLWRDIRQPQVLYYLARSLEKLGDGEQAAVFHHLLLRVLDDDPASKAHARTPARKALCQRALKTLDKAHRAAQQDYADTAAHKTFTTPDKVSDLWMTQVQCDLRGLHGLYAWKLVGGRKDLRADWIHNTQGEMHRSGAKLMADVHGRRGVLFCIPSKKSKRLSRVVWDGPVQGRVLRVGTRAYGFPYVLNVVEGGRQVSSTRVGRDAWCDLKIPLGPEPGKDAQVLLELVIPESQRWMEGAFFDYIDFFDD